MLKQWMGRVQKVCPAKREVPRVCLQVIEVKQAKIKLLEVQAQVLKREPVVPVVRLREVDRTY
jgi:hypothetical protein